MDKLSLTVNERDLLRKVGLSKRTLSLYEHLLEHESLTAKKAAVLSNEFPAAEYRLFEQLEKLGLIVRSNGRPAVFTALPKKVGLKAAYLQFRSGLELLIVRIGGGAGEHHTEIIVGRRALYKRYIELAEQSKHEICIYAIGIAFSKELVSSQESALARGVRIRHVLQQVKPSNFHVAYKWQRLGVRLRHAPSERGFHMMLFDGKTALISFSNPNNTDDRLSLLTNNPAALRLFEADFRHIWANARKIDV